jgi:DNA-binding transcriptional ArsR family regulator
MMPARASNMAMGARSTHRVARRRSSGAVFRAIADPTRREILGLLRGGRQTVGEIAGNFRMSRPAISEHLRLLRSAGLVDSRQEGTSRLCGLNAKPLLAVNDWLHDYESFWSESLQSLKKHLEEKR